tara:strand:+ start:31188 stop:31496 length:309 start_codon:yes stop_codon:yes gene_type:complete
MAIEAQQFAGKGTTIQVAGMSGGLTGTTAIAVSGIIEVADVNGSGGWVAFGASGMSAPSADAANAYFIPPYGVTRPFVVSSSYTHIMCSAGAKINVRKLDIA